MGYLGAFLLTPSHELSLERAALICEKMNFKGYFSLTKTATGILFKFSHPEDYQAVYKKGFHKVTGARFYKKIAVPCRPQKTFTLFVFDVPEDLPVDDIRHSLYRFNSVVEVVRLVVHYVNEHSPKESGKYVLSKKNSHPNSFYSPITITITKALPKSQILNKVAKEDDGSIPKDSTPPPIRITLASVEEYNHLLQNGLDFYGATFFPTESNLQVAGPVRIATRKGR